MSFFDNKVSDDTNDIYLPPTNFPVGEPSRKIFVNLSPRCWQVGCVVHQIHYLYPSEFQFFSILCLLLSGFYYHHPLKLWCDIPKKTVVHTCYFLDSQYISLHHVIKLSLLVKILETVYLSNISDLGLDGKIEYITLTFSSCLVFSAIQV